MGTLFFEYGAMGSSKSAQLLMLNFNYREKGKKTILLTPSQDTRDEVTKIKSRIGLEETAYVITPENNILDIFDFTGIDVVIADEAQFLSVEQIEQLKTITEIYDIPVYCFGLKTNFQTHLFPASQRLLEIADNLVEIKSICQCGKKAIINARIDDNGRVVTEGEEILVGGNEHYVGMCYECYKKSLGNEGFNI